MELKQLISHFSYRIEPKPGGGFIARAADPAVAPLEATTRQELQKKIQANIVAGLSAQFPGLKLPLEGQESQFAFHVEHKPEGGFVIHSADPNAEPIEVLTHNDMQSRFAEKLIGFVGKHLDPQLSQALAAQGNSADVKVIVDKVGFTLNTGSRTITFGRNMTPTGIQSGETENATAKLSDGSFGGTVGSTISNAPITPEASGSGKVFRFLMLVLIAAAVMYFFFHYR